MVKTRQRHENNYNKGNVHSYCEPGNEYFIYIHQVSLILHVNFQYFAT